MSEQVVIDFNKVRLLNPERGRHLLDAAQGFTVKAPLVMSKGGELSVELPASGPEEDLIGKDLSYFRQVGTSPLERWYGNLHIQTNAMTQNAPAVNTLFAYHYLSGRGGVLDRIAFNVTTGGGAGSKTRVGIYDATSEVNLYPRNLLVDGGEFDSTSTGVKSTVINLALVPNRIYWLVFLCGTAAPTVRSGQTTSMPCILGLDSSLSSTPGIGITVSQTYGALPPFFPPGGTVITASPHPLIAVRYSG